jgi:hypothetical protein
LRFQKRGQPIIGWLFWSLTTKYQGKGNRKKEMQLLAASLIFFCHGSSYIHGERSAI